MAATAQGNPSLYEWACVLLPYFVLGAPFLLGAAVVLVEDLRYWLFRRFGIGHRKWNWPAA
jgi:hypothetical protein